MSTTAFHFIFNRTKYKEMKKNEKASTTMTSLILISSHMLFLKLKKLCMKPLLLESTLHIISVSLHLHVSVSLIENYYCWTKLSLSDGKLDWNIIIRHDCMLKMAFEEFSIVVSNYGTIWWVIVKLFSTFQSFCVIFLLNWVPTCAIAWLKCKIFKNECFWTWQTVNLLLCVSNGTGKCNFFWVKF